MEIKDIMLKHEENYSKYATFDKESIRFKDYTPDIRPNFFRDTDRIIYSSSYTRYIGKTQVFTLPTNDNVSRRSIHVQLVAKIARSIGRALSLNEDLIEAIALGHDLGHVPYGHIGERFLNEISLKHNEGYFNHNVQSVRNLMVIENNGEGLNLSVQVLDGILCHNGELELQEYRPKKKTTDDFLNDYNNCYNVPKYVKTLVPMTLEGCVVRLSDIIAYLGRDIEDAEKLGLFNKKDIPKEISDVLGTTNREIVNSIIDKPITKEPYKISRANIYDNGELVDDVLLLKYVAPKSYTGEDMVEITCHGSVYVAKKILSLLIEHGASMADHGEFTKRAFLNNKITLLQAEGINNVINSNSEKSLKIANKCTNKKMSD